MSLIELLPIVSTLSDSERLELMNLLIKQFSKQPSRSQVQRLPGHDKGKTFMADDFDAPLFSEILDGFENSELMLG